MFNFEKPAPPKATLPEHESREIAKELYAQYEKVLTENLFESGRTGQNLEIQNVLEKIPSETLHNYWGHGITKGQLEDHLAAAISILANKALKGSWAPLAASGYVDAYQKGSFLVISHRNDRPGKDNLAERGPNGNPVFVSLGEHQYTGEDIRAAKINMGAFVVNDYFEPLIHELRARFPEAPIISAAELEDYIKAEESKK